ncbi:MAG: DedA family protein [Planctomycetaceae bacterium]|nr:DedA family protein [Planctomycetota bacterium]NUN53430.1 DedA family protein [Planctomycetaceae bacterium]
MPLAETAGLIGGAWEFVQDYPDPVLIGLLLLCGVGLPVPEEPILLMAGAIAVKLSSGQEPEIQLLRMTAVCAAGILAGDVLCFHLGRKIGRGIFRFRFVNAIATRPRRVRAERFFQKYGPWSIFIARFFAGVRLVMYFSAGMSHRVSYLRFLLMDFLGVLVSVPISIWIGYIAWKELQDWDAAKAKLGTFHGFLVAGIATGLMVWFILWRKNRAAEKAARWRRPSAPPGPPG